MRGTPIAHAELSVLAQLPAGEYGAHFLWTTLEPCLLCQAAATMTHIGQVRYLAADAICLGLDGLPSINANAARRYPQITGPGEGLEERFAAILPIAVLAAAMPDGWAIGQYRQHSPDNAALAVRIVTDGSLPDRAGGLDAALDWMARLLV